MVPKNRNQHTMTKALQRVSLEVSIHWRYLHQDKGKTWSEISKMKKCYAKYSKATISRHMVKNIGDLVPDKRKKNQSRPSKLSERQKRNILIPSVVIKHFEHFWIAYALK